MINLPTVGMVIDTCHFFAGGSTIDSIKVIDGKKLAVFHINDVEKMPREHIQDANRLFPGDGVIPLKEIISAVRDWLRRRCFGRNFPSRILAAQAIDSSEGGKGKVETRVEIEVDGRQKKEEEGGRRHRRREKAQKAGEARRLRPLCPMCPVMRPTPSVPSQ